MTPPNNKITLPPPRPEMLSGISVLSDDELCYIIGVIIARPGDDFTEQELDELSAINAEFRRREVLRCRTN